MIRAEKYQQALTALHGVIIRARFMAYGAEDSASIAALLDDTEYLVQLIAKAEDCTETYTAVLKGISERFPYQHIFTEFSREPALPDAASATQ